ncbi:MAG: molecular chaperone HtpG, partial [Candidatus Electrothrix sp. AR3]|nr:molecular chaperone HtpG [Candidatus Electrothrix sp. AR3]
QESLCKWMKEVLGDKVKEVKASNRLVDSPAMIVNVDGYMTSSMERIMAAQGKADNPMAMAGKKDMEINTSSTLIKKMADLRAKDQDFAKDVAEQIYDNAMIQAGLIIDHQEMVNRNYRILERMSA